MNYDPRVMQDDMPEDQHAAALPVEGQEEQEALVPGRHEENNSVDDLLDREGNDNESQPHPGNNPRPPDEI